LKAIRWWQSIHLLLLLVFCSCAFGFKFSSRLLHHQHRFLNYPYRQHSQETFPMSRSISTPLSAMSSKVESELDHGDHSDSSEEPEMPSKLIDGNAIAARIRQEIADSVIALKESSLRFGGETVVPGLSVILGIE
jgi:hypothetical protein